MENVAFSLKGVEIVFADKYLSIALCTPGLEMTAKFQKLSALVVCLLTFPVVGIFHWQLPKSFPRCRRSDWPLDDLIQAAAN